MSADLINVLVFGLFLIPFATAQISEYPQITEQICSPCNPCSKGLECINFPNIGSRCAEPAPCSYYQCSPNTKCKVLAIEIAEICPDGTSAGATPRVVCQCIGPECTVTSGSEDTVSYDMVEDKPYCAGIGTKSEGWYNNSGLIRYDNCAKCEAKCGAIGTKSEGWYSSCDGELIKYGKCTSTCPVNCECDSKGNVISCKTEPYVPPEEPTSTCPVNCECDSQGRIMYCGEPKPIPLPTPLECPISCICKGDTIACPVKEETTREEKVVSETIPRSEKLAQEKICPPGCTCEKDKMTSSWD